MQKNIHSFEYKIQGYFTKKNFLMLPHLLNTFYFNVIWIHQV